MSPNESHGFRLTVLNPSGRDREQFFREGAGEPGSEHAPVNFHAFAACTDGTFQRDATLAIAQETSVLLLLRGDFRVGQRALAALKKSKRTVVVSLKETGMHQIAQQLRDPARLSRFVEILSKADGCIGTTPEAAEIFRALLGGRSTHFTGGTPSVASQKARDETELVPPSLGKTAVGFIPTPYPVDDTRWDFSRPNGERAGIFVGTREWNVPTRNHLAALLLARDLGEITDERVTVFNCDGRRGVKLLGALNFRSNRLRVIEKPLAYPDYLREVSRHRLVLQLDSSFVPGQVAGDALLCRIPCVGGNGAIDRIAFSDTCGFCRPISEIKEIATRLLTDNEFYAQTILTSQTRAKKEIAFEPIAKQLRDFFEKLRRQGGSPNRAGD